MVSTNAGYGSQSEDLKTKKMKKAHVLFVGAAYKGHFGPLVQLMYRFEAKHPGLTVTVMGDKDRIGDLIELQKRGDLQGLDLHLEQVFGPIPIYPDNPQFPIRPEIYSEMNYLECEPLRKKLVAQKDIAGGPTAIISDMAQPWSKGLADELGVPWYAHIPLSPMFQMIMMMEGSEVEGGGVLPPAGNPQPNPSTALSSAVPGLSRVAGCSFVRFGDLAKDHFLYQPLFAMISNSTSQATAVLCNSSEALDYNVGALAALRALTHSSRVLPVGPSLQHSGFGFDYAPNDSKSKHCLHWLDSHPTNSVIYIAFGSLGFISKEEIMELAVGLEASGVPFLWALKLGSLASSLSEVLPPGFQERTKGRGLIETGWAPQVKILFHPSTGGFLSHCGWNSTLESISAGVPLIAWPLGIDQFSNARFITNICKVGFAICNFKLENKDNFDNITRREIEKAIRLLMLEEEGAEARRNVVELQRSVEADVKEGGSSYQNLHNILDEIANV